MPGGRGREARVAWMWLVGQARGLSVRADQPWRPGPGGRGSQPYLGPRGFGRCPGDKMIDWVSPACGDAAAQSNQAARLALGGRAGGG